MKKWFKLRRKGEKMKANRIAKDESGADASDAIIILALILGVLLVLVYIGHSLGGVGSTIGNWWGDVTEGASDWFEDVTESASALFGGSSGIDIEDSTLKSMYEAESFIITANNTATNYRASLAYVGDTYRRYVLMSIGDETSTTSYLFGEAGERLFGRAQVQTFTISDEAMSRLERLRVDETLTLEGENYSAKITAQGKVGVDAQYILEIRKRV